MGKDVTSDGLADRGLGGCYEPDTGMVVGRRLGWFGHLVGVVVKEARVKLRVWVSVNSIMVCLETREQWLKPGEE